MTAGASSALPAGAGTTCCPIFSAGGPSRRPERAAWQGRRMAGRAPARLLADPRRGAGGRGRNRHPEDRRLQSGRQRGLGLFRGQPAPWAALERGDGVFEADPQTAEPASRDRRACRAHSVRGASRDGVALHPARRQPRGACRAGSHPRRRRDRLAAAPGAFGRGRPGSPQGRSAPRSSARYQASAKICRTICSSEPSLASPARARSMSTTSRGSSGR